MPMHLFINFIAFQIGWFSCVLGAANGLPLFGPVVVLAIIGLHLKQASQPARELALILVAGVIGATWDSLLVVSGWLAYPNGTLITGTAPYWIVAMWMLFATTLNVALRWLRGSLLLAAALGGIAGPLAYYGGVKLGGLQFNDVNSALIALACGWAVLMPALSELSKRFDGIEIPLESSRT